MLFHAPNHIGVGHINRLSAIAIALRHLTKRSELLLQTKLLAIPSGIAKPHAYRSATPSVRQEPQKDTQDQANNRKNYLVPIDPLTHIDEWSFYTHWSAIPQVTAAGTRGRHFA